MKHTFVCVRYTCSEHVTDIICGFQNWFHDIVVYFDRGLYTISSCSLSIKKKRWRGGLEYKKRRLVYYFARSIFIASFFYFQACVLPYYNFHFFNIYFSSSCARLDRKVLTYSVALIYDLKNFRSKEYKKVMCKTCHRVIKSTPME
jgi:hypothetical protein